MTNPFIPPLPNPVLYRAFLHASDKTKCLDEPRACMVMLITAIFREFNQTPLFKVLSLSSIFYLALWFINVTETQVLNNMHVKLRAFHWRPASGVFVLIVIFLMRLRRRRVRCPLVAVNDIFFQFRSVPVEGKRVLPNRSSLSSMQEWRWFRSDNWFV